MQNKEIIIKQLGIIAYEAALTIQETLHRSIIQTKRDNLYANQKVAVANYLLFCQHLPVYTYGRNSAAHHLLIDADKLQQQGAMLYSANRGGSITYHGPGQLIVYPIIDLENFFTDIDRYLRLLEITVIETLDHFNLTATTLAKLTGVWLKAEDAKNLPERKICSIGIRIKKWVTMHGLALNINNDLTPFHQIIPCGIPKQVTSMQQELNKSTSINSVSYVLQKTIVEKLAQAQ